MTGAFLHYQDFCVEISIAGGKGRDESENFVTTLSRLENKNQETWLLLFGAIKCGGLVKAFTFLFLRPIIFNRGCAWQSE